MKLNFLTKQMEFTMSSSRLQVLTNNKVKLNYIQEFKFNGYMKFVSFFLWNQLLETK